MSDAVQKVRQALKNLGSKREVVETQEPITTVDDASQAVGVTPGEILKSLLFLVDGSPWLVLMSGANKVHNGNVKRLTGGKRVTMAPPDWIFETYGYRIGGVPPVGYDELLPALVDEDIFQYETVWAAAGSNYAVFPVAPEELLALVKGRRAAVKKTEALS